MADYSVSCEMKTYPASEFRAVDMAELTRALTLFEGEIRDGNTTKAVNGGIIEGCRIDISTNPANKIRVSRGRILISGRLAEVKPEGDSEYVYLDPPAVNTANTTCYISAVCDLSEPNMPFYLMISDGVGTLNEKANRTTDANFNRSNGLRYLRLGTVKVNPNGFMSDLTRNDNSYAIKSNKTHLDAVKQEINNALSVDDEWLSFLRKSRHKADFFTAYRAVADGLTVPHGSNATFKLRSEYGSKVYFTTGSGSVVIPYAPEAHVLLNASGAIQGEKADTANYPVSPTSANNVPTGIIENPYKWKFLGINEVRIENATTAGSGAANCVIQSFYSESASGGGGHVCAVVRNLGTANAKIKLTIRSMYVADIG